MQPGPTRVGDVLRVVDDTTLEPMLSITCLSVITMVAERQDMSEWADDDGVRRVGGIALLLVGTAFIRDLTTDARLHHGLREADSASYLWWALAPECTGTVAGRER